MNKNRKEYIDSINEIKVDNEMKRNLFEKIEKKEKSDMKRWFQNPYVYGLASLVIVLVFTTVIAINMNKNVNRIEDVEITASELIAQNKELPTVDSFEKLYTLLKVEESKKEANSYLYTDMAAKSDSTREMALTDDAVTNSSESKFVAEGGKATGIGAGSSEYFTTNVQVEGVDEADIVKTDGQYIYYVSSMKVVIVDAKDPANLKVVSEIKDVLEDSETFSAQEVFINSNKLIIIGVKNEHGNRVVAEDNKLIDSSSSKMMVDSIYPYYDNSKFFTVAKVFNLSNKANPTLEREVAIEGNYLNSRMIGSNIYFMANKYINLHPYYNLEMKDINEDELKPLYRDTIESQELKCLPFTDIYYCPESESESYLNLAGFNIINNNPANIESILGAGDNIYSSEDNLYITNTKYKYEYADGLKVMTGVGTDETKYEITTTIYKFTLNDSKIIYNTAVQMPGSPLNQFSMDEMDGFFRIAATNSTTWDNKSSTNNVYVFDDNMQMVGKLENLAPGERIYSARFMGNRLYMVTFVQTDPLFVIDLSNPTSPKVLGELKIPGYSKYLHPYDETHIIGFGENTKTVNYGYGDVVTTDGMKMALFDVTDPTNPKEMFATNIGEKGTYSEILYNHKALLFSKEKNIIAFPITISKEATTNDGWTVDYTFQGAIVYGLNLETGFTLKGQITHRDSQKDYRYYDYNRQIDRIIYIKDNLFTLSKGLVKATDIATMQEKGNVKIEIEEQGYRIMKDDIEVMQETTEIKDAIVY